MPKYVFVDICFILWQFGTYILLQFTSILVHYEKKNLATPTKTRLKTGLSHHVLGPSDGGGGSADRRVTVPGANFMNPLRP
jgi:hypothetical protein